MIFLEGIIIGLTLALVMGFGPSFFTLIQTSISRGFKSAMWFDLGVFLNDIMIVALMIMTNIQFDIENKDNIVYAGIAAGIILIVFGIYTYGQSPSKILKIGENNSKKIEKISEDFKGVPKWHVYLCKGFIINIFNPFVWIFWVACVTAASTHYSEDKYSMIIFFTGVFLTAIFFDVLKALGAYSLKKFFTEKMLKLLNRTIGVALIIFGLFLIVRVLFFPETVSQSVTIDFNTAV